MKRKVRAPAAARSAARSRRALPDRPARRRPSRVRLSNPWNWQTTALRTYLNSGINPYDFMHLLEDYFDELGDDPPESFVEAQENGSVSDWMETEDAVSILPGFKKWLDDEVWGRDMDEESPAYMYLSSAHIVPPQTWLVHFSDHADRISLDGFTRGVEDMQRLGLTTYLSDHYKSHPGWNFGLQCCGNNARDVAQDGKYGKDAVLFQSAGVSAYHGGDEETQVMFWGPFVRRFILLQRDGDGRNAEWFIEDAIAGRELRRGYYVTVAKWAIDHAQQYRRRIVREI